MTETVSTIFISYASQDKDRVLPFFEWLEDKGFDVWIDSRRLKPGQNWDFEIKRALEKATFILAFISKRSYERRGYIQRELKIALDRLSEKLIDDIYLIPVLLDDDVQVPSQLSGLQSIRASDPRCREQIADALQHQLERLGVERRVVQEMGQLYWTSSIKREEWDGIPGYEVELQFLEFESDHYSNVNEIGDYIKGILLRALFDHRTVKIEPLREHFNYGQDKGLRTNTYDAHCSDPVIVGKVISIKYSIYWYGAGAAHGNSDFMTCSFLLEPVLLIESLRNIFREPDSAFAAVQAATREQLYEVSVGDDPTDEDSKLEPEWIIDGTKEWEDFKSFVFHPDGIEILFPPYSVAAYACGPQFAKIPYDQIAPLMRDEYISALRLQHLVSYL